MAPPLLLLAALAVAGSAFQANPLPSPSSRRGKHHNSCTKLLASIATTVDISENAQRDIPSLYDWAANYGVQTAESFELSTDDGVDIFAITNQNLPANAPVLQIPGDLIMSGNNARMEFGAEASAAERALKLADHPTFYLFLKVLREYELGEQSPWYQWLNSLPRFFANAASMTDFCFSCLPPYAAKQSQLESSRLKRFENALDEINFPGRNPEVTKWAYNIVTTRYQEKPGGDYVLIPMGDYFNHGGNEVDVSLSYDDNGNCYAYSTRDVPAGQPLRICYTDPTNPSQTLAKYGFLDESSPWTYCKWTTEEPSSALFEMGYPSSMLFCNDGSVSSECWDVLLYEELGKMGSPSDQQAFYQAHINGDEATKANYHQQYFAQTLGALQNHVSYILNELDERAVWERTSMDTVKHPRLPLIMTHNEFVRGTFLLVQQNLNNMG
ncbi:hypothetical protein ACHAXT_011367 [Thalassiosira profunda]